MSLRKAQRIAVQRFGCMARATLNHFVDINKMVVAKSHSDNAFAIQLVSDCAARISR